MARWLERDIQAGDRGLIARIQAFYIQSSALRQASIRTIRHLLAGLRPTGGAALSRGVTWFLRLATPHRSAGPMSV
jgi:hypothetical protein